MAQALKMSQSPYYSPLVTKLSDPPNPLPACATCPASMWRATTEFIECYCKMVNRISWNKQMKPTIFCDGREAAIERLREESG